MTNSSSANCNSEVLSLFSNSINYLLILAGGEQECSEANEGSAEETSPDHQRESSLAE